MTVMKKGSKKGGKEVTAWGKVDYREATAHKMHKKDQLCIIYLCLNNTVFENYVQNPNK